MKTEVRTGFMAALLHDLGKVILNNGGTWEKHYEIQVRNNPYFTESNIDFKTLLGSDGYSMAKAHHKNFDVRDLSELDRAVSEGRLSLERIALFLADKLQKGMYGISGDMPQRNNPCYLPYYGQCKIWDKDVSRKTIMAIDERFSRYAPLGLKEALDLQELCIIPHTTFIPHISLALHQRFSALLYYFIFKKLEKCTSVNSLSKIRFSIFQISPDPPNLLYRMKDVRTLQMAMVRLRRFLIEDILKDNKEIFPELSLDVNPFEFFSGDSVVLIYDDKEIVLTKLQQFINQDVEIRTLHLKIFNYTLDIYGSWEHKGNTLGFFSRPEDVSMEEVQLSLLSDYLRRYPLTSEEGCSRCNMPIEAPHEDEKGDILCEKCFQGRKMPTGGIDLHEIGGESSEIGFISVTLPEDIRRAALTAVSFRSIPECKNRIERKFADRLDGSQMTKEGIFEYLQAVSDIGQFQHVLNEKINAIRGSKGIAIYQSPSCILFVLNENAYWKLLGSTLEEKRKLHIDSSIKGVICNARYPFWRLIDKLMTYTKEDIYYDVSERSVVMFTDGEIMSIRNLADLARKERVPTSQLQTLLQTAIQGSLEELVMQIDVRERERKLGQAHFASRLVSELRKLKGAGDNYREREKRSIFIKYISKLAR
jgi:hypothetical protein